MRIYATAYINELQSLTIHGITSQNYLNTAVAKLGHQEDLS